MHNTFVGWKPLGFETMSLAITATSATSLTIPTRSGGLPGVNAAIIRVESSSCRWRDDGTQAATATGMPLLPADPPLVYLGKLSAFTIISAGANAIANVTYYRVDA